MTTSPLFAAAGYLEAVWRELDHLAIAIPEALRPFGVNAESPRSERHTDDYSSRRLAYFYTLWGIVPRQRISSDVVLYLDLHRGELDQRSLWPLAQTPLLVVAYAARDGWDLSQLEFDIDGRFVDDDAQDQLRPYPESDGRLIVWEGSGPEDAPLLRRDWLFGVPVESLTDPGAVDRELIQPLVGLLKRGLSPREAFHEAQTTVVWPLQL